MSNKEQVDKEQINKEAENNELLKKINTLKEIAVAIDMLKEQFIDNVSYQRISAGIAALVYGYEHSLEFQNKRQLHVDDESIKEIADMAKTVRIDSRDIVVKKGIYVEIEYLMKFLDFSKDVATSEKASIALAKLVANQSIVNKKIEHIYEK